MTRARFFTIAIVSAAIVFGFYFARPDRPKAYPAFDFAIFYCAGAALDSGRNPYLLEPLRSCERAVWPAEYLRGYAEPAPLAGFDLAPFMALALVPYGAAKLLWLALSAFAFGIAVAAATKISRLPPIAVFALLAVPVAVLSIRVGQLGPFIAAPLLLSAAYLNDGRYKAAGVALLACAIEPNVALPVLLAAFVLVPSMRATVALGCCALAALHLAVLGPSWSIGYFTQVLPAMSRAEADAADQFGSIWTLHRIGLAPGVAAIAADVLFAIGTAVSIALARMLVRSTEREAFAVAVPAALATAVNPYLHDVQLCAVLVLPLAALPVLPQRGTWIACAAVLAMPWFEALRSTPLALQGAVACAVFVGFTLRGRFAPAMLASVFTVALFIAAASLMRHLPLDVTPLAMAQQPIRLAAQSWQAHLYASPLLLARGAQIAAPKIAVWFALVWLFATITQAATAPRQELSSRRTAVR